MTGGLAERRAARVVHIIHSGAVGGGPRIVLALATHFNQGAWRSAVICSDDGPLTANLRAAGVEVVNIPLATLGQCVRSLPRLGRVLRALAPDLVHTQGQFAAFFGNAVTRAAARRPVVYTAQFPSFITDWDVRRRLRNDVAERVSCLCADALVCVSDSDRQEYLRRRLIDPCKAVTIYNGVNLQAFGVPVDEAALRRTLGIEPDVPVLGFFGRLTDQKGAEFLVQALPLIAAHHPACRLLIVGDGPERERLERVVAHLGSENRVHFLGMRADVASLMAITDVVVVPSLFEPFGIVAVEAMASGKPVVATAVEGLREVVADAVTGRLVPPQDPPALAEAVHSLLADPAQARALGQAGRQRAQALFSAERMFAAYTSLYQSLLERKPS